MKALIVVEIRNNEVATAALSRLLLWRGASANRRGIVEGNAGFRSRGNLTNAEKGKKMKSKSSLAHWEGWGRGGGGGRVGDFTHTGSCMHGLI